MDDVIQILTLFVEGVVDAVSVHRTFEVLVNCQPVAVTTGKILVCNLVVLLGSLCIYEYGITPAIATLQPESVAFGDMGKFIFDFSLFALYYIWWVVPIFIFCYISSMSMYQDLGDAMYLHVKKLEQRVIKKDPAESLFGLLVWIFMFVQMQLLTNLVPFLTPLLISSSESLLNASSTSCVPVLASVAHTLILTASVALQGLGVLMMSLLYGWYGFDPQWIAVGLNPVKRFQILEARWPYYIGYGAPYVVMAKSCSFFWGYGLFLGLFPFCIMLALKSRAEQMEAKALKSKKKQVPSMPFFSSAKTLTLWVLKTIDSSKCTAAQNAIAKHKEE